jgi:hypothetical protein
VDIGIGRALRIWQKNGDNGDVGNRNPDLLHAKEPRYRLRHIPNVSKSWNVRGGFQNGELVDEPLSPAAAKILER